MGKNQREREAIARYVRCDLENCIQDAQAGKLAPHWQAYARREIATEAEREGADRGTWDLLRERLESAIQLCRQPTDEEDARSQLEANGDVLEYFYSSADYGTMMEIVYAPRLNLYTAAVYLDREAASTAPEAYAAVLHGNLRAWCSGRGVELHSTKCPEDCTVAEQLYFDSLEKAADHLAMALANPRGIFC